MHPKHVLDFVEYKIVAQQLKHDINKALYEEYKAKHEALWYNKLFRRSYADSWDSWDWQYLHVTIKELETIKKTALYKVKMEYEIMDIPETWHKSFYAWANENNVPY